MAEKYIETDGQTILLALKTYLKCVARLALRRPIPIGAGSTIYYSELEGQTCVGGGESTQTETWPRFMGFVAGRVCHGFAFMHYCSRLAVIFV